VSVAETSSYRGYSVRNQ